LKRTSDKLAFAYRSTILESKDFKKRVNIATQMERQFLSRYFGENPKLIDFAKSLIAAGDKSAAKELNRVVSVLGKGADAELVIRRVKQKFNNAPSPSEEATRSLARRVIDTRYVDDAEQLIHRVGGTINRREYGFLFTKCEVALYLNTQAVIFKHDYELVDWIIENVASKYK
jgi:hypothetical protein